MCRAVNRYLARPARPEDVVWQYSGVRPLYDDGTADPSAVTRDYTLRVDDDAGEAPKRMIVQFQKGSLAPLRLMAGLVLHEQDGRNTGEAEAVLRHGAALRLV